MEKVYCKDCKFVKRQFFDNSVDRFFLIDCGHPKKESFQLSNFDNDCFGYKLIRYSSKLQMIIREFHPIEEKDLFCLTQREAKIFKMRFNKDCSFKMTLKEIGDYFNLSKERIRQIEAIALCKLRFYLEGEVNEKR